MGTFSQWATSYRKKPEVRQLTWLCGTERVLIEDVIQTIKEHLNPADWNYVPVMVGEHSERMVWQELDQHPADGKDRLVVVRNAEKLVEWGRLDDWVKYRRLNAHTHVIFVSNEEKIARKPVDPGSPMGAKGNLVDHLALFTSRGSIIECRPYTQATAKYAVEWVQSKVSMREGIAAHLLNRSNGDLRLVRDVCVKLAVFPEDISLSTINGMMAERPRDSFADALLALDKKTALLALVDMSPEDYSRTIGFLDTRLDLAGLVHDMQSEHRNTSEIVRAAGNKGFLVRDLLKVAKHYDSTRRLQIRRVLAAADEALRGGERVGVLEAVVAFW